MRIFEAKLNNWYSIDYSGWKFYYFHPLTNHIWFVYRQFGYNLSEYKTIPAQWFNPHFTCRPVKKKKFPNDVLVGLQEAKVELL